jgi:hypothetical protein
LESGGFYCFSCHARGGDIVAYLMLRDGIDFKNAAQLLGAWENWAKPTRSYKVVVGRDLVCDFVIDGTPYSARVKDDPRHWLDVLRRVYRAASDRLIELNDGEEERFEGEAENCWSIMSDTLPQIRQAEVL